VPRLTGVWKHTCFLTGKKKLGYVILIQAENEQIGFEGAFYAEVLGRKKERRAISPFRWSGFGSLVGARLSVSYWNEIDEGESVLRIVDGSHMKGSWRSTRRSDRGHEQYDKVHELNFVAPFNPIFRDRAIQDDKLVFVLMPFAAQFVQVYDTIRQVVGGLKLRCLRADEIFVPGAIMGDIWKSILASRIIIAELTGHNPNVFYELGIAHSLGKEVILLCQSAGDIPFDLRHMRTVIYSSMTQLRNRLLRTIKSVMR